MAGSLIGAVTSRRVTEVSKGSLITDGNREKSTKAKGSLTARQTTRTKMKVGLSDPVVESGIAIAQQIKAPLIFVFIKLYCVIKIVTYSFLLCEKRGIFYVIGTNTIS